MAGREKGLWEAIPGSLARGVVVVGEPGNCLRPWNFDFLFGLVLAPPPPHIRL